MHRQSWYQHRAFLWSRVKVTLHALSPVSPFSTKSHRIDVFLGGGLKNFINNSVPLPGYPKTKGSRRDGLNLLDDWKIRQKKEGKRSQVLFQKEDLDKLDVKKVDSVLGIDAIWYLPYNKVLTVTLPYLTLPRFSLHPHQSHSITLWISCQMLISQGVYL